MELDEFRVLDWEASSGNHTATITSASMGRCAREVGSTVTSCGDDSVVGFHSVDGTVSHVVSHDTSALTVFHNKIHTEIFDEENAIVTKGSSKKSMEHTMASSVCDSAASISLTALSIILRLTSESSLIDLAFLGS